MPFRDDEDARLARLSSLESENEKLRAELEQARRANEKLAADREEAKREAKAAARERRENEKAPTRERDTANRTTSRDAQSEKRRRRFVVNGLKVAAVIAVAVVVIRWASDKSLTRTATGIAYFDGVLSVKITSTRKKRFGSTSTRQVASFDLATGKRLGSVEIGNATFTYPTNGTRTWARVGGNKLALLDLRAPAIVIPSDQLTRRIPELAAGYKIHNFEQSTNAVALVLADGSRAWLDPEPRLSRTPPPSTLGHDTIADACNRDTPSCESQRCFTWIPQESSTTLQPGWRSHQELTPTLLGTNPVGLHVPRFVKRLDRPCALEIDGGVLIRHESSAIEPTHRLLSLLGADGTVRWSRRIDELAGSKGIPVGALPAGERIQLLFVHSSWIHDPRLNHLSSRHLSIVHLSAKTGETLARHRLL